jgi:hypothetical protein
VIDVTNATRTDVEQRLRSQFGYVVGAWSPIVGGAQNRLFRLDVLGGPTLLIKLYHQDRWNRLEREYTALSLLGRHGLLGVPRVYLRSDDLAYAVYSFARGQSKRAAELDAGDLRALASFAADLQGIAPSTAGDELSPAVDASFSIEQQLNVIDIRMRAYETFVAQPDAYSEVRDLHRELDLRGAVNELTQRAVAGMRQVEREAVLPRRGWRINTADFGPQNMLFTTGGELTVVDFEASGWDDPARLVMGFVAHAASEDLTSCQVELFLATYADACRLPVDEIARFESVGALYDLEWIAIYASALTSEAVAAKQFASREFDQATYLADAVAKLRGRLARATDGKRYRFPAS